MLVVAHLFGGRSSLYEVLEIVRSCKICLVEDCSQSFERVGGRGHADSHVVMHSFGPIKIATAFGGRSFVFRHRQLRKRKTRILRSDPVQSRADFAK